MKCTGIVNGLEQYVETIDRVSIGGRSIMYPDNVGADEIDNVTRRTGKLLDEAAGTRFDGFILEFDNSLGYLFDTIVFKDEYPAVVTNPNTGVHNASFTALDGTVV